MSYHALKGKEREKMLRQVKRQVFKKEVAFREDNRPVGLIDECYRQINDELFSGKLPKDLPVIYNGRLKRTLGKAFCRRVGKKDLEPTKIEIQRNHNWTNRFLRKVLTHEMCHIWAFQEHNEKGHGKHFWRKMKELGYPDTHDWDNSEPYERDKYC